MIKKIDLFLERYPWLRYLLYVLILLPSFFFRDYTPDNELKYISIVDEALRNNSFFAFFNQGEIYADKPPLYLWMMMLARVITGGHYMWIYGLFALIPAAGIMWVMDRWMRRAGLKHNALVSNLMLGTTIMYIGSALVLRMDMLMTLFIVLSLYSFWKMYAAEARSYERYLLPVYIFLALFTKGPTGIMIPVLSIVAFLIYKKELRSIGKYLGWRQWVIMAGLSAIWFLMVYVEGGYEYLHDLLFRQTVGRGINSFHHKAPIYFYVVRYFAAFAPWCLLYLAAIISGLRKKLITTDIERLFLVTIVVNFVMLSLISSKLDIYMLPIYPFVVYLASGVLSKIEKSQWIKWSLIIPAGIFVLVFPFATAFVSVFGDKIPGDFYPLTPIYIALFILSASAFIAIWLFIKKRNNGGIISIALGMLLMVCVISFNLGRYNSYIGFKEMAGEAKEYAQENGIESYYYYSYPELSYMDTYMGITIKPLYDESELQTVIKSGDRVLVFFRNKDIERSESLKELLNSMYLTGENPTGYQWRTTGISNR